nr:MAG TPA: hypothetical protein [Caudoviricetes sp.]
MIHNRYLWNKCYFSVINVRASQIIGSIAQLIERRCTYVVNTYVGLWSQVRLLLLPQWFLKV